jgi:uncharacterized protein (TIGR03437 family)
MRRWRLLLVLAAISAPAPAYYHFVHYLNGVNVRDKFDLTALPNSTVTFFVSEAGPTTFNQTDTFNSVLSQIQQAAQVWNGVSSSAIRVAFGGLENVSTPQNTPAADVVFEDLPPGIYGYGGPTTTLSPVTPANGTAFIPITRSTVYLNRNLTILPPTSAGPSYTSSFFMTVMHEMGHALGLQHTFTSATMSQATTQATTVSHPLDADDIAGLSVLYPAASFSQFGTITGQVTSGGKGLHLSSVVAIHPGWGAVSALTNPDGTFQIQGVPPGQYFVYAHTLPPDANILGPWSDVAGSVVVPASGPTTAAFYATGAANPAAISVQAGQTNSGINISPASRSSVEIYDVEVLGYFTYNNTSYALYPAYLDMQANYAGVNACANGCVSPAWNSGVNVQVLGDSAYVYGTSPVTGTDYLTIDIAYNLGANPGPQHLIFTNKDYMYVAPASINLTQALPPTVASATPNGDGTITVTGSNWASDSLIYFDGLPTTISSLDPKNGIAVVVPPPGPSGQTSVVSVYNSDSQNSQFFQLSAPVTYSYPNAGTPSVTSISPASLPAGAESMIDITGSSFNFVAGQVTVGFGTSDIVVQRVFVLSPTHLQVDVAVSPNAALSNPDVSVMSGFQLATAPAGFQITAPVTGLPAVVPILTNAISGLTGAYPGALVSIYGTNLAAPKGPTVVTIGGQSAPVLYASASQVNLQIPTGLTPGPAVLNLNNSVTNAYPVVVSIDTLPATIGAVQNNAGGYISQTSPAHQGDYLIVSLNNFAPSGASIVNGQVQVGVGGVMHSVNQVSFPVTGLYQVGFWLNANEQVGASQPLIVYLNGRSSYPATLPVATPGGSFTQTGTQTGN